MARNGKTLGSTFRVAGRVLVSTTVTLAVFGGAAMLVQIGAAELERRADAVPAPMAAPPIPVSAKAPDIVEQFDLMRRFVGQIEPARTTDLSFELGGQLAEIAVDEGDHVTAGQVIARLDRALLEAEGRRLDASRTATLAQLRFADQTVVRTAELSERGFTSQAVLDEALARQDELRARIQEIDADLQNVKIRLERSEITAPFDGQITSRHVDGGETLSAGQPVAGLVETAAPTLRIGVPLDVTETQLAEGTLEIDGMAYPAILTALRPDIDPVTRTRTALLELPGGVSMTFGQTAVLSLPQAFEAKGLWLPVTSLKEGLNGQWTVMVVDPDSIVRLAPVEVLHAESTRVFVRAALPTGTMLVEAGPQRLTTGQRVTVNLTQ